MKKYADIFVFILVLAVARLLMTVPNFEPVGAMALFGGAMIGSKRLSMAIPLLALFVGDVIYGLFISSYMSYMFSFSFAMVYLSFILITLIGRRFIGKKAGMLKILGGAVAASVLFFILTNFGSWIYDPMYTKNLTGLIQSYAAGLAFYKRDFFGNFFLNTLMANVLCSTLIFGAYRVYAASFKKAEAVSA